MNKLFPILAFLFSMHGFAQRDTVQGTVKAAGAAVPGVFIINKNTGTEVKTGAGGQFSIMARNGDRLVAYSGHTEVREFTVGKEWFAAMPFALEVQPKGYELETVVITDETRSAEALGIVPKGQKHNTVAQRRLYTATGDRPLWQYPLGLLAGSMPLDPFINAITGKTRKMEQELATEVQLANVARLSSIYTTAQLTDYLAIPQEQTEAFLYYAATNPNVLEALDANNHELAKMELTTLASRYNSLQAEAESQASQSQLRSLPATGNQQPATKPSTVND
jgi:hypothetical protein